MDSYHENEVVSFDHGGGDGAINIFDDLFRHCEVVATDNDLNITLLDAVL